MLIGAYRQMITRAHEHGIKVAGGTLTPFEGAAYYSENGNKVRHEVNQWIRTGGAFDWVADFDRVIQDPAHADRFKPEFDSSDHLHPNDAGYKAMAGSIDLSIFSSKGMSVSENSR
jgi:lysophospholipase L1-like esterase